MNEQNLFAESLWDFKELNPSYPVTFYTSLWKCGPLTQWQKNKGGKRQEKYKTISLTYSICSGLYLYIKE